MSRTWDELRAWAQGIERRPGCSVSIPNPPDWLELRAAVLELVELADAFERACRDEDLALRAKGETK
jgi:hypothetical protein